MQDLVVDTALAPAGETIEAGDSIRNQFLQAVYEQISQNLNGGGVAQGSNFWNLYTVGVGSDDPYQITLADTSTMAVVAAQVRPSSWATSIAGVDFIVTSYCTACILWCPVSLAISCQCLVCIPDSSSIGRLCSVFWLHLIACLAGTYGTQ